MYYSYFFYGDPYDYYFYTPVAPLFRYPPINLATFQKSSNEAKNLLADTAILINQLASSNDLRTKIMTAAQASDQNQVDHLIQSTGVKRKVKTTFTPDGIHFSLKSNVGGEDLCHLDIALRW